LLSTSIYLFSGAAESIHNLNYNQQVLFLRNSGEYSKGKLYNASVRVATV
jgi:hypothetical protein